MTPDYRDMDEVGPLYPAQYGYYDRIGIDSALDRWVYQATN